MADTFSLQMIGRLDRKNTEMIHFIEKIIILEKLGYLPQEIVHYRVAKCASPLYIMPLS